MQQEAQARDIQMKEQSAARIEQVLGDRLNEVKEINKKNEKKKKKKGRQRDRERERDREGDREGERETERERQRERERERQRDSHTHIYLFDLYSYIL